jgi:hypothetical protein
MTAAPINGIAVGGGAPEEFGGVPLALAFEDGSIAFTAF